MDYMEELTKSMTAITVAFDEFKAKQDQRMGSIETRLARPGAFTGGPLAPDSVRMFKTADGREHPFLSCEQKLSDLRRGDQREEFSLGEFVRSAMLGGKEGKASSGPALVPTGLGATVIDRVRAETVIVPAGAGTILIDGPKNMARLTGDPTVHQHTEGAADITESDITAEAVALNPKLLAVLIPLTVELVADSPNLDQVLTTALTNAFAAKLDALSIAKLLADANIPKSAATQDPALWAKTLEAIGAALAVNQALPGSHISAPADFIARAGQQASTAGSWLGKPPALASMREFFTTGLSAGTALFGDFAAGFAIAMREELRIEVVRHQKPTSAQHLLVAHMRADGIVIQPARLFKQLKTVV